ncbi:MAG: phosphohistidine phosphatase SixA [Chthoniobacterales bacterium]|jgi:phosphohistidine phosphatase
MTLFLLRHAEAESLAASDSARRLTGKGEAQAERTGKFCRRHGLVPEVILSSPVARALQTARIVAKILGGTELIEVAWAACGMAPHQAVQELDAYRRMSSVMLVGHQPDLGALASSLIGCGDPAALHVRKSLLCAIEITGGFRHGLLEFFVPVRLMD